MNDEMESKNAKIEDEIKKTEQHVKAEAVRSINKGNQKVKKMLVKVYTKEMKYRFGKWREAIIKKNEKNETVSKVIFDKMKKRLYQ